MQVKVTEYNSCNDAIRWQMSKSTHIIFYICDFRKYVTYVNDYNRQTHRHAHTHRETDKPMAIGDILQICLIICVSTSASALVHFTVALILSNTKKLYFQAPIVLGSFSSNGCLQRVLPNATINQTVFTIMDGTLIIIPRRLPAFEISWNRVSIFNKLDQISCGLYGLFRLAKIKVENALQQNK